MRLIYWDYEKAFGDTINEKFEDLYCTIHAICGNHPNILLVDVMIWDIFACATAGFVECPEGYGIFHNKWVIVKRPSDPRMHVDVAVFFGGYQEKTDWKREGF